MAVTIPVYLGTVNPQTVFYDEHSVFSEYEIRRLWSSFFLGTAGIFYLLEIWSLYNTSIELEVGPYKNRSFNYAWELVFACASVLIATAPLGASAFSRPLLVCLTTHSTALAPDGTQSAILGLVSYPVKVTPFFMVAADFFFYGSQAAARSIAAAIVGYFWAWCCRYTYRADKEKPSGKPSEKPSEKPSDKPSDS